jgi:hypothetical protein
VIAMLWSLLYVTVAMMPMKLQPPPLMMAMAMILACELYLSNLICCLGLYLPRQRCIT